MQSLLENNHAFFKQPVPDKVVEPKDHFNDLRNFLGATNIQRLSTRFSIVTLKLSLLSAGEYHLLDSVEWLLGRPVNIAILDSPLSVYNALSVGLFAARFLVNVIDILQHTLYGSEGTMAERFYVGIQKHHYQLINDVVWGIVNALGNYPAFFHIPLAVPNFLMLGFTVFDIAFLAYELNLENQKYAREKEKLNGDLAGLEQLEREHEALASMYKFGITAACLMLATFTAAFVLCPPVMWPLCFLVCNVAIAMFLSIDKYSALSVAQLILKQEAKKGLNTIKAEEEVQKALNDLGFTVAKNVIAPIIILGAFTLNVPAAIALTMAYVAYECGYLTSPPQEQKEEAPDHGTMALCC